MPRKHTANPGSSKIGAIGNTGLFAIVLAALTIFSFAWPAFWAELVKEESAMILGVAGDVLDLRALLGISISITFAILLLRGARSEAGELVFPAAGVLAGVAIAGGGWGASLGLAAVAVAALVRPAPARSIEDLVGGEVD